MQKVLQSCFNFVCFIEHVKNVGFFIPRSRMPVVGIVNVGDWVDWEMTVLMVKCKTKMSHPWQLLRQSSIPNQLLQLRVVAFPLPCGLDSMKLNGPLEGEISLLWNLQDIESQKQKWANFSIYFSLDNHIVGWNLEFLFNKICTIVALCIYKCFFVNVEEKSSIILNFSLTYIKWRLT